MGIYRVSTGLWSSSYFIGDGGDVPSSNVSGLFQAKIVSSHCFFFYIVKLTVFLKRVNNVNDLIKEDLILTKQ
jgi:hypothetical protein